MKKYKPVLSEPDFVAEPTATYEKISDVKKDATLSIEELQVSARRGMQQIRNGKFYTHEEVKKLRK